VTDVFLARPRGFCAGVHRAISIVSKTLELHGPPVYVLHEIVHNTHVISDLAAKGAVFVERLEDVPTGAVTIFSAHGVSLAVIEQARRLGLRTVDATCPLVAQVHRRVTRLNADGCDVLVIGHKGHPEVEGTCGHAVGAVHLVSTPQEAEQLQLSDPAKVGCVTQTTLSVDDTAEILAVLRRRFPELAGPHRSDICFATTNRQRAVRELAELVDLVLVVGSKNSSNSNRLREVARKQGIPAYLIDDADEIDSTWLHNVRRIGVTAGASAPEHLVKEAAARLRQLGAEAVREMDGEDEAVSFQLPDLLG
jgi:4-hydroxy-3-methylbut-2-enyl diphosphate reductase